MNPQSLEEALSLVEGALSFIPSLSGVDVVFCVPFVFINEVQLYIRDKNIFNVHVAAQNCFAEMEGAYTGEISPLMLSQVGVSYCVVGHSERRILFHETDEIINKKVCSLGSVGVKPILCIGESEAEQSQGLTLQVVKQQLTKALLGLDAPEVASNLVVAYEPVWAIGSGNACSAECANSVCEEISNLLAELYNVEISESIPILYGGSVKPNTAPEFLSQKSINGLLVGGASLDIDSFNKIIAS